MNVLTLGSLFDGIGGFPLAAMRQGITPLWASEIEPFPMEVTRRRFPNMPHKGDITQLSGRLLLPVDLICGGSPCQDLSVARAGGGRPRARPRLLRNTRPCTLPDLVRILPISFCEPRSWCPLLSS